MKALLQAAAQRQLTVPLFGKLLFLAWGEANGKGALPSIRELNEMLLSAREPLSPEIRSVMHIENDVESQESDGSVRELTDYIFAAQRAGLIRRANPSYKAGEMQIGAYDAKNVLSEYEDDFAQTVSWLRNRVRDYLEKVA